MAPSPQTITYLIRHGIAAERGTYANDDDRPLTIHGKERTHAVALRLRALGCTVDCILSSPLVRAQQTTEILLGAGIAPASRIFTDLSPGGRLQAWLDWLQQWQEQHPHSSLALVGHEPDLSHWGQRLVTGESSDRWTLKKAGVIGIKVPAAPSAIATSQLFWLAPPRLLL